jgi:hypothetical protein
MVSEYKILWTEEALRNLEEIRMQFIWPIYSIATKI